MNIYHSSHDQVQKWLQAPDLSRREKEKLTLFQAPGFIRAVNPGRYLSWEETSQPRAPKSKIQNPKSNDEIRNVGKLL